MELALQIIAGAVAIGYAVLSLYRERQQRAEARNTIQLEIIERQDAIRKDAKQVRKDISSLPDNVIDMQLFGDKRKGPE